MLAKKPRKITQRLSSVTNAFVQAVLPRTALSLAELAELRVLLEQDADADWCCVYCGAKATEWDHLQPLVVARRPSGNLNSFGNLVPACGPCNHSKGAQPWRIWMVGEARNSPARRGITDLDFRIARLGRYERRSAGALDLAALFDPEDYRRYWTLLDSIEKLMRESQILAEKLRDDVEEKLVCSRNL